MAANITVRMNGNVNAWKVTNAEWARILAYYQDKHKTQTEAETVTAIASGFVGTFLAEALRHERDAASAAAIAAVASIAPTSDTPV